MAILIEWLVRVLDWLLAYAVDNLFAQLEREKAEVAGREVAWTQQSAANGVTVQQASVDSERARTQADQAAMVRAAIVTEALPSTSTELEQLARDLGELTR